MSSSNSDPEGEEAPIEIPPFDLETYVSHYRPESDAKLNRLLFVAERLSKNDHGVPDHLAVSKRAYELAAQHMKEHGKAGRYRRVFGPPADGDVASVASVGGVAFDAAWCERAEEEAAREAGVLRERLRDARARADHRAVRAALVASADAAAARGDAAEAARRRADAVDHGDRDVAALVRAAVDADPRTAARRSRRRATTAAAAVAALAARRYARAADLVAAADGTTDDREASAEDAATYGTLAALACRDRAEFRDRADAAFRRRLESVPPLREAVRCLHERADYRRGLEALRRLGRERWALDLHLSEQVDDLLDRIRDRCMVEYFRPFRRVRLETMGWNFHMDKDQTMETVERLILDGSIVGARINAKEGTLVRKLPDDRGRVVRRVRRLGDSFLADTESLIFRLSYQQVNSSERRGGSSSRFGLGMPMYEEPSSDEEDVVMMDI